MARVSISQLATPAVSLLICFLSYSSQFLFLCIEPEPLSPKETIWFNVLVSCIWISYIRACKTDPGRVPSDWQPADGINEVKGVQVEDTTGRSRWCRKCQALKPPRSHHCKTCKRCIPKMDHHCPWTENCVSHFTLPHFIRFVFYATATMSYLAYFLYIRAAVLWKGRNLPSYLGPSAWQLVHLFVLILVNSITLFAVSTLLVRTLWHLGGNTTTIEGWEIERHETLLRRARVLGGYLDGPDGVKVKIQRQEFPYDIGIWENVKQGMGSGNALSWFWPFAASPPLFTGFQFEINGFEDASVTWPPPDPDRIPRKMRSLDPSDAFTHQQELSGQEQIEAFRRRQQEDIQRRNGTAEVIRRKPFHERYAEDAEGHSIASDVDDLEDGDSEGGEEGWKDSDGDRLRDFGVDEEVEFYDEDDVALGELLRRRRNDGVNLKTA